MSDPETPGVNPPVRIILMHGTILFPWMRTSVRRWTRPGSAIRDALQRQFGDRCLIETFDWSGRNSFNARLSAAKELEARLTGGDPGVRNFLVCHSHAGNACLLACRSDRVRATVAGIVTMATPFLLVRQRPFATKASAAAKSVVLWTYGVAAIVFTFAVLIATGTEPSLTFFLVMAGLAFYGGYRLADRWDPAAPPLGEDHLLPDPISSPVLILRCTGDEATGAFATATMLSMAASRTWISICSVGELSEKDGQSKLFHWVLGLISGATALVVGLGLLKFMREYLSDADMGTSLVLLPALLILAFALVVVVPLLSWLGWKVTWQFAGQLASVPLSAFLIFTGMPFGLRPSLRAVKTEVTAEATPLGRWEVETFASTPLNEGAVPLNHSQVYDHPAAIQRISDWIHTRL